MEQEQSGVSSVKIEFNDIVKYIGPVNEDNIDLVQGKEYTVLVVKKDRFEIIDLNCGFPIRLSVFKQFVELVKKNPPPRVEKEMTMERLVKCPCGEDVALKLIADTFIGDCLKCECHIEYPKSKVAA
jgi:hypothetical protein